MKLVAMVLEDSEVKRILENLGLPANFPLTKPPRAPPLPFSIDAREGSQEEPRGDDERQDWPGRPGPALTGPRSGSSALCSEHSRGPEPAAQSGGRGSF